MPYNTRGQSMLGTGALTPALVSPVAKFTFSNLTTSLTKPSHAKISLKRDSDEKKRKKVRFGGIFRTDLVSVISVKQVRVLSVSTTPDVPPRGADAQPPVLALQPPPGVPAAPGRRAPHLPLPRHLRPRALAHGTRLPRPLIAAGLHYHLRVPAAARCFRVHEEEGCEF